MKLFRNSLLLSGAALLALFVFPRTAPAQAAPSDAILQADDAAKVLPDAVFYAGKSANTQLRNATGIHWAEGEYTLAVLVDTSGYSSSVQEKYQGYLLTEVPLFIGAHHLPAGAYGFGFVNGHFLVMDIGNHDLFHAPSTHDAEMHGPRPLQVLDAGSPGTWRLCSGRDCVKFIAPKSPSKTAP
jgi:hypothetical protein